VKDIINDTDFDQPPQEVINLKPGLQSEFDYTEDEQTEKLRQSLIEDVRQLSGRIIH
tara:strand:- start:233 stop:403 length:171 start_codon:yes stop_codon:yes gene_type:complete